MSFYELLAFFTTNPFVFLYTGHCKAFLKLCLCSLSATCFIFLNNTRENCHFANAVCCRVVIPPFATVTALVCI